jgi:hypothetical protein
MQKFLKVHEEWVLGTVGFILASLIVVLLIWGVTSIGSTLGGALSVDQANSGKIEFHTSQLKTMNLRGVDTSGL